MNINGLTPNLNTYKKPTVFGAYSPKEIEHAAEITEKRAKFLPKVMDKLVADSALYAKEHPTNSKEFAETYLKSSTALFKRANTGLNNKEYRNNYKPELNLIGKVSKAFKKFISNILNENNLNDTVDQAVLEYSKIPIKREKSFIA